MKNLIIHSFVHTIILCFAISSISYAQFRLPPYEKHILDNGLTLYLMEQHEVPLIYASVIFPAGAVWDQDRSGLAAFTAEALLFGSKNYSKDQIEETFDFLGASINSYAGQEAAEVYISFKKNDFDKLLPVFVDVITNPSFSQSEFDKRKQRWLAELEQDRESPRRVIRSYFNKFLFDDNPYGNPVAGTNSSIKELTVEDLNAFFGMHYQLSSAGLVLVGDFSIADMKSKIESFFPPAPKMELLQMPYELSREINSLDRNRLLLVNKDDSRETTFLIGGFGVAWNNPAITQIQVVNTIFGGRFTSWLNDELRVNSGLTYGAGSSFSNYKNAGTFFISSFTATKTTIEAIDLALEVLNRMHTEGVDEETLTSAKNYLKGQFPPNYETSGDLADLLTTMHFYGLNDSYINDFEKNVDAMTFEKANEIIAKYFPKENLQFVLVGKADEIRDKIKKYGEVTEKNIEDNGF
ncbi:MAG: insulinase family protein [Ignavibacteria bacterium]|nr:insulinase family protein [Ignavibacteria bacterium]